MAQAAPKGDDMRKMTRVELETARANANRRASLNDVAVMMLAGGIKPDATARVKEAGTDCTYSLAVYGAARVDGGIVIIRFDAPMNGGPAFDVRGWEEYRSTCSGRIVNSPTFLAIACAVSRMHVEIQNPGRTVVYQS